MAPSTACNTQVSDTHKGKRWRKQQLSIDLLNHSVDESEFCPILRLKSFEVRTSWRQMGRADLVTWTVLYFQFHTHQSLQHFKASHYFQTVAELCLSVHNLCPSKSCPFGQIKTDASAHAHIFTAWRYAFRNQAFKLYSWLMCCVRMCVWGCIPVCIHACVCVCNVGLSCLVSCHLNCL